MPNHLDGAGGSWAPSRLRNQGPSDTVEAVRQHGGLHNARMSPPAR
jgi:hypothetical protein